MSGRIVVGVDGSEGSRRALQWAIEEAALRRARLEAVTVWESPYDFGEVFYFPVDEQKLADAARTLLVDTVEAVRSEVGPAVEVEPVTLDGDAAARLCELSVDADLLVVGARGHGGFAGLVLGSVSSKCAHHSRCPIVIVPGHGRRRDAP